MMNAKNKQTALGRAAKKRFGNSRELNGASCGNPNSIPNGVHFNGMANQKAGGTEEDSSPFFCVHHKLLRFLGKRPVAPSCS